MTVHPGSWLGDAVEEFKKAPPAAKIGIVVAFVAVAGIGFYEYRKNGTTNTSGISGSASPSTDLSGTAGSTGAPSYATVPGGNTGQVPILPAGLQPLFDASGSLIGFEPNANTVTNGTTTGSTTGTTPKTTKGTKKKEKKTTSHDKGGDTSGSSHSVKSKSHNVGGSVQTPSGKSNPPHPSTRKVKPNASAGGAHGYVYTAKGGESLSALQKQSWPGSIYSNRSGQGKPTSSTNIRTYANNAQLIKSQHIGSTLKKGQKIVL